MNLMTLTEQQLKGAWDKLNKLSIILSTVPNDQEGIPFIKINQEVYAARRRVSELLHGPVETPE